VPVPRATAALLADLPALAAQAERLEPPPRSELSALLRDECATLVDGLLVRVARGRGAIDVALGQGLAAIAVGDRLLRLGYSSLGDYARERLGIGESSARAMAKLAGALRTRPHLWEAVRSGEVSARKATTILAAAHGDAEAAWVQRARVETVRSLAAAVKAATGVEDERLEWERLDVALTPEARAKVEQAMALAGEHLGAHAPRWQRLEALCQEFLAGHADVDASRAHGATLGSVDDGWLEAARAGVEEETERWAFLEQVDPVAATAATGFGGETDPRQLDLALRQAADARERWDELLGHLALLVKWIGLWRDMGFADFGQYCAERLGMAERTVSERAWLARRLYSLPALRDALRERRLSYEKARLVARHADRGDVDAWIARAEEITCIALRREVDAAEDAQMCARGELSLRVPRATAELLDAAFRTARAAAGRWLTPGECLERIAEHFLVTWKRARKERMTLHRRVVARDGGFCQVPGCSRPAVHAHHVILRARGGADAEPDLTGLCAAHHLHGVHAGYVRVRGTAPDALVWTLAASPVMLPTGSGRAGDAVH
jgi:hypothetical protein